MDWLTAKDYAKSKGVHKQWILRLCRDGRLYGAYKAGAVWLIPDIAPMPASAPGPRAAVDLVRQARIEAEMIERANALLVTEHLERGE